MERRCCVGQRKKGKTDLPTLFLSQKNRLTRKLLSLGWLCLYKPSNKSLRRTHQQALDRVGASQAGCLALQEQELHPWTEELINSSNQSRAQNRRHRVEQLQAHPQICRRGLMLSTGKWLVDRQMVSLRPVLEKVENNKFLLRIHSAICTLTRSIFPKITITKDLSHCQKQSTISKRSVMRRSYCPRETTLTRPRCSPKVI